MVILSSDLMGGKKKNWNSWSVGIVSLNKLSCDLNAEIVKPITSFVTVRET